MNMEISARYEQANNINQGWGGKRMLVRNDYVLPNWIVDSHCFWYVRTTKTGKEYRLVDPLSATNSEAFDHKILADVLSNTTKSIVDYQDLPIKNVNITLSPMLVRFTAFDKHWEIDVDKMRCEEIVDVMLGRVSPFRGNPLFIPQFLPEDQQVLHSPDGKRAVFIREHNIWVRDVLTGQEKALTEGGTADYSYSSSRLMGIDTAVQAQWSPDSRYLFTVRRDTRNVVSRNYINYAPKDGGLRPEMESYKWPSPYDKDVDSYQLVVIDVTSDHLQVAEYPPLVFTRSGLLLVGFFRAKLGWWSHDSRYAFFIDIERGAKVVRVLKWDIETGNIETIIEEKSDTFVKLCHESLDILQHVPLPYTNELIWFSEIDGWAHLYLYDLNTGELKNQITGSVQAENSDNISSTCEEWLVRDILHYDDGCRELLIQTAARDSNISPYYRDICKVNIDTGVLKPLVSGNFEYNVYQYLGCRVSCHILSEGISEANGVSPCGKYIVTTKSRVDTTPVTLLIDRNGKEILILETADVTDLPADWVWPEPVKLKSADEKTDIYGVVFRPPGFSVDKSYPVVEYENSARCYSGVPQGAFINSQQDGLVYYFASALAALGFVVVALDGRGTPLRNKSFSDHHYGDHSFTSDFSDRIAGMRQLAKRYTYMDIGRVGIVSPEHPTSAVYALLKHSDFYKVSVIHCLTDPRFTISPMDDMYHGTVDEGFLMKKVHPEDYAESFSGKLLLIVGMKSIVATTSAFRLVDALQKTNRDVDMLCMPSMDHEMTNYTLRREWDYLVRYLQGVEPKQGFQLSGAREKDTEELLENISGIGDILEHI